MGFIELNKVSSPGDKIASPDDKVACPGYKVASFVPSKVAISAAVICRAPGKLERLLEAIRDHECVHYVSDGTWSLHQLVMALLPVVAPAKLYLSTFALRETPARQLVMALKSGIVTEINLLIHDRAKVRTPEVMQMMSINTGKMALKSVHAKATVIMGPERCYTIIGSANFTTNPKIETGIVTSCSYAAAFHRDWIMNIIENGKIFK